MEEQPESNGGFFEGVRFAASELLSRFRFSGLTGITFGGKRDTYKVLGYKRELYATDYRERYERDGVAARIVEAFPNDTWRGGADLVEDDDPETLTEFEEQWADFAKRLKVWSVFERADVLAGLGRFAVIVIGAPGEPDTPLPTNLTLDQIVYLQPYSEADTNIAQFVLDVRNERFGLPEYYTVQRTDNPQSKVSQRIHYSRILHVSDGMLDDNVFGTPRLKRAWNRLDDLEKVVGGGSEAFWLRANQGTQFNLDKDFKWPAGSAGETAKTQMRDDIEDFVHGISRTIRTKGMEINTLGSDVADFSRQADALFSVLSAITTIPKRILMGSERGELASSQDKTTWDQRVADRREKLAGPYFIDALVSRLTEHGALPEVEYQVKWLESQDLNDKDRAALAIQWASINKQMGETVVTAGEIRDRVLGLAPLEEVLSPEELAQLEAEREARIAPPVPPGAAPFDDEETDDEDVDEDEEPVTASAARPEEWVAIHRVADRSAASVAVSIRKEMRRAVAMLTAAELTEAATIGADHVDALVARSLATVQPRLQKKLTSALKRTLLSGRKVAERQVNGR